MNIKKNATTLLIALAFLLMAATTVSALVRTKNAKADLRDTRNQLAQAVGSVEIAEGVYMRQAEEFRNLRRNMDEVLSENTRLTRDLFEKRERIASLMSVNASLRETIQFNSSNAGSNATTTVISGCDDDTTTTVVDNNPGDDPTDTSVDIPNLRVDFELEAEGFMATGHTTTNPTHAELSLDQIEPFRLDVAVTEDRDGQWAAYAAEVDDRLDLEIAEFAVNPYVSNERWYERFGVGLSTVAGPGNIMAGPTLSAEIGKRTYAFGGVMYDVGDGAWAGSAGVTWRPFRQRRNR